MADPISFTSLTPRFGLPLLFLGQAQKEFYINEALALVDSLMHPIVEGISAMAPASPISGQCWIVEASAEGVWFGREDNIACYQSGSWLFAKPSEGMRVFHRSAGVSLFYRDGWQQAAVVTALHSGENIDVEAREAIAQLISALATAGVLTDSAAELPTG